MKQTAVSGKPKARRFKSGNRMHPDRSGLRRLRQEKFMITIITQQSRPKTKKTYAGSIKDVVVRHNGLARRKEQSVKYLKTSKHRKRRGISPEEIQR